MTQIDFYVMKESAPGNRFTLACRLAEKAYKQQRRVFVYTGSQEESIHMDRLLWTFRQGSFIPHGMIHQADASVTPVLIGHDGDPGEEHDVLINLSKQIPPFFSRFERLAEPLDQTPEDLAAGRSRFRYYRERGYDLQHHEVDNA